MRAPTLAVIPEKSSSGDGRLKLVVDTVDRLDRGKSASRRVRVTASR